MNTRILFAVGVSMFVCQQVHAQDEDEPVMPEATELEGTWEMVSYVWEGEQGDVPDGAQGRFEGNRMYHREGDDEDWTHDGTISVAPSAMPAEIDIEFVEFDGEIIRGIYEVDGDTLTICFVVPREDRPDRFESTEESQTTIMVFRRVEGDDE